MFLFELIIRASHGYGHVFILHTGLGSPSPGQHNGQLTQQLLPIALINSPCEFDTEFWHCGLGWTLLGGTGTWICSLSHCGDVSY